MSSGQDSKSLKPLFNEEYYQAFGDFITRKIPEHKFIEKLRALNHSNELIDLSIVSSKAQGSGDILSGCRKVYEGLMRSHRKTPMGFQAPYMLKQLPSLMKIIKANSSK